MRRRTTSRRKSFRYSPAPLSFPRSPASSLETCEISVASPMAPKSSLSATDLPREPRPARRQTRAHLAPSPAPSSFPRDPVAIPLSFPSRSSTIPLLLIPFKKRNRTLKHKRSPAPRSLPPVSIGPPPATSSPRPALLPLSSGADTPTTPRSTYNPVIKCSGLKSPLLGPAPTRSSAVSCFPLSPPPSPFRPRRDEREEAYVTHE